MINKKGIGDVWMTLAKLVIAGFFILFILWLGFNLFANLFGTKSQGTTQQYKNLITKISLIPDNGSLVFPLWQIDSSYGEYGFNVKPGFVKVESGEMFGLGGQPTIKKPLTKCSMATACICLCDKKCDKIYECNVIPGIKRIVVSKDFTNNYGLGVEEYYGEDFKDWEFLAAIGEYKGQGYFKRRTDQNQFGKPTVNISRSGDTLYFWPCKGDDCSK